MLVAAALIKLFSLSGQSVEKYYSNGLYPWIGFVQRIMFGWIPFSIGDVLYACAGAWLLFQVIKIIRRVRRKTADKKYLIGVAGRLMTGILIVYVTFNLLWGLNYNRVGMDHQMKLAKLDYEDKDLLEVTRKLAERINELHESSKTNRNRLNKKSYLFDGAIRAYDNLEDKNSIFNYSYPSVKPSIFSYLGNYLGFTGYYNPFTGEAQVNTTTPYFIRPFTTCHEIGHQLGYAKESEANFASFLSATSSTDPAFIYSVYFEMFAYAGRYLYYTDSLELRKITAELSPGVKNDINEIRTFYRRYQNPIETAVDRLYSQYLKANEQPSGKMSYNEVVAMLIAYYKKYGTI